MRAFRVALAAVLAVLATVGAAGANDPSWPKEVTFGLLSTENAAEITRRWAPILAQLEKDLGVKVKYVTASDYRGTIEALKFKKAELGWLGPKAYIEVSNNNYAKVTFSGSHEASILAVANKKVDIASTNLPDLQQLTREGKVTRGALRVIWVSKLIPNDPVVVRKDLAASLRQAVQESLLSMRERVPEAFAQGGAFFGGGFARADDAKYQIVRDMNDAAKKLAAQK